MRYLDPKNDLTFKKVFGEHPHLLKSLLNAVLPLADDAQIVDLEYLPTELVPLIPLQKNTVVDVRCVDTNGRHFIVQMQMLWTDSFMNRVLFNTSKAYVKQLDKGGKYKYLQPVYALNFIDDEFDKITAEYYHHYQIVNIQNTNQQLKGLEFVFVELPKFKPQGLHQKKLQVLWLRFLTEIKDNTTTIDNDLLNNTELREAIDCLQESAFTNEELEAYDKYWDQIRIERTLFDDALIKGKIEGKIEVAVLLNKKGFSIAEISEITGITIYELEKIFGI